ncbi:MAG: hypothetical protein U0L79_05440 [Lachnospiraceae bacterium]|nr:hypothetical protein [Lachnospiraceae bacterium]
MRLKIMKKLLATMCVAVMIVGSMSVSALGEEPLKVTTNYDGNNPSVSVNKTDGVSYQWYELEAGEKAEAVYNIVDEAASKIYVPLERGIYYENENKWIPEDGMRYMHLYIECKAGDVINVTWLGGVSDDRVTFNNEICVKNGDVYSKTIVDDGIVEVNIRDEATPANVVARIELVREGKTYAIADGMRTVADDKVCAKGNYDKTNNKWSSFYSGYSRIEYLETTIYMHEGESVLFDFENKGDRSVRTYMTDENGIQQCVQVETELDGSSKYMFTAIDSTFYTFEMFGEEAFTPSIQLIKTDSQKVVDGQTKATLTDYEEGKYYACKVSCGNEVVWSNTVVGHLNVVNQPTASNPMMEVSSKEVASYQWHKATNTTYNVIDKQLVTPENADKVMPAEVFLGTFENEKWVGQEDSGYYMVYIGNIFEAGYTINIKLISGEADMVAVRVDGDEIYLDEVNENEYMYEITESDICEIGIGSYGEFTAQITLSKDEIGEAIAGQNTNKLKNHQPGVYMCVATLKDGTKLYSRTINVTANDYAHTYTDINDTDCNECGAIREVANKPGDTNVNPNNGGTSNGDTSNNVNGSTGTNNSGGNGAGNVGGTPNLGDKVNMIWLLAIALIGAAVTMYTTLNQKRV